jgi:hypothetical protein
VRRLPPTCTVDAGRKFVPVTVMVVGVDVPVLTTLGLSESVLGTGLLTAIAADADAPPPGAGLTAVTLMMPADERSPAVSWKAS